MEAIITAISHYLYDFWQMLLIFYIALVYYPQQALIKHKRRTDIKNRKGQVAIVTGGSKGIGLEVVKQLLGLQMHVIIACRKPQEIESLLKKLSSDYSESRVEAMELDLCSLQSVREFAKEFLEKNLPLHLLINNAGIMFGPYTLTSDGFEAQLGTNYLGHFLLTQLLLPKLKETGTAEQYARIVNVSSNTAFVGTIRFDDLQSKKYYSTWGCYSQSKLAQVLYTWSLQEKLSSEGDYVTVSALHPGMIYSNLYVNFYLSNIVPCITRVVLNTPTQGANIVVYASCSSAIEGIGARFYVDFKEIEPPKLALNREARRRLWDESCSLVGIKE